MRQGHSGENDNPTSCDYLGFEKYCISLNKFIMHCETPMTVSLQGGWGTGKTSMFLLMKKNLEEQFPGQFDIIEVNTWQYSVAGYQDNLILILMSKICERLGMKADIAKKFQKKAFDTFALALTLASKSDSAGEMLNHVVSKDPIDESFQQLEKMKTAFQDEITKKYNAQSNRRLIIFIDDLDRLEPIRAVELLEGIKNFIDCAGCVFILAIDEEVIYEGIRVKFGEHLGERRKQSFFDKIIQVPFSLPVESYDIQTFIAHFQQNETGETAANIPRYVNVVDTLVRENNPRSIKRLLNLLELHESFFEDDAVTPETRYMLFALVAFQVKYKARFNELCRWWSGEEPFDEDSIRNNFTEVEAFIALDKAIGKHFGKSMEQPDDDAQDEFHPEDLRAFMQLLKASKILCRNEPPCAEDSFEVYENETPLLTSIRRLFFEKRKELGITETRQAKCYRYQRDSTIILMLNDKGASGCTVVLYIRDENRNALSLADATNAQGAHLLYALNTPQPDGATTGFFDNSTANYRYFTLLVDDENQLEAVQTAVNACFLQR